MQRVAAPLLVVAILALMVLPIPSWLLDGFFTLNIAVALMVMMVAAYMTKPLDFAAFPSVLLLTTLMRLSLNVASTRVVLLEGHTGPGAAGAVIEAFGHFLIGGNFAVGLIVFAILVVINFVVVTKGSERIAEVSARFTLDAMPGKQMAVDADLNAGVIDEKEARRRRAEVAEEANFFGSMDGASKFVRGDAIAGILILVISIVGGFTIGVLQHGLGPGKGGRHLRAAGGGRRAGRADSRPADLGRRGDGGVARGQGGRRRQADRAAALHLSAGAGHHGRHPRHARHRARHAARSVPRDGGGAGLRRMDTVAPPAAGAARRAGRARARCRSDLGRPAAGRTCWAWSWATG